MFGVFWAVWRECLGRSNDSSERLNVFRIVEGPGAGSARWNVLVTRFTRLRIVFFFTFISFRFFLVGVVLLLFFSFIFLRFLLISATI